jgi:lysophospholipase L1-like esterase
MLGAGGQGSGGAAPVSGGSTGSGGDTSSGGGGASGGADAAGGTDGSGGEDGSGGAANAFSPCPAAGTPCAILPLGDSITEGFGSSGGGYRVELFRQALQNNQDITFVGTLQNGPNNVDGTPFPKRHQGHGGFTIDTDSGHSGISGSITQNALSMFNPHIVLLMIGTNDINGNVDVNNAPNRLGNLIDDITTRAPDALVIVASVAPVVNSGTNQRIVTYNSGVKNVAEARAAQGKHVQFLDNYAAIFDSPNWSSALMGDNLHPNDAGYAVFGRSFYAAIEPYLP